MTNAELIEALRCCIVDFNSTQSRLCNECPYGIYADGKKACENKAKRDAADALEAQQTALDECARQDIKHINPHGELREMLIDEIINRMGEWEERHIDDANPMFRRRFYCSRCGEWTTHGKTRYCPNCGAKMKGKEKDDEQIH